MILINFVDEQAKFSEECYYNNFSEHCDILYGMK